MAKEQKLEKHLILAELVERWARKNGFLRNAYIERILPALINQENLAFWAATDPFVQLPHAVSQRGSRFEKVAMRLTAFRNALVFAPVAITWIAVSKATSAFEVYIEKNVNATVNFLQFWQDGYGLLGEEWQIEKVALFDAIIVFIVICLSFAINFFWHSSDSLREKEEAELEDERAQVAFAIKEYLFSKQTISRLTLNRGVATAIENLVQATENLQRRRRR